MKHFITACFLILFAPLPSLAQESIQNLLQSQSEIILKSSRKTIGPAIELIRDSKLPVAQTVLETWQAKDMWYHKEEGAFYRAEKIDSKTYRLFRFEDGEMIGEASKSALKQIKPNSGIRALIANALVQFQLLDPDPARRLEALTAIQRAPETTFLAPLRSSIEAESIPALKAQKQRLERLLTIQFDPDTQARIDAIEEMSNDLGVDVRAALNPILDKKLMVFDGPVPINLNVASLLQPGSAEFSTDAAYDLLVAQNLAPPRVTPAAIKEALIVHIKDGKVGGVPVEDLHTNAAREQAYDTLAQAGLAPQIVNTRQIQEKLTQYSFAQIYDEPSAQVTAATQKALAQIARRVGVNQTLDLGLDALSLASIYFLAAIGLAITFGVMGVINMAHGEFIMMGAYTGYVVQLFIANHTLSIIVAVPLAFAITFAAGVVMERLVIRWLYSRPLETLLATFGISIALQQLAKNIFGTQARPLTAPAWLNGAWVLNDVVSISYIRIAIFVLALIFLVIFLYIMRYTRLGLETRAVTQNPRMAASMGINTQRVNMLTFGLGSGIAGVAGVAIGLFAKVTSELGSDYIVQSFMTVVVGGVGNIFGTLAGATMIGTLQKGIEWLNPSNTLAAQTYMIIFIIIFIQFRPKGIIALKGRAAGD